MPTLIAIIVASVVWVVSWGLGLKGFDGFLAFLLIVLGTATVQMMGSSLSGRSTRTETD